MSAVRIDGKAAAAELLAITSHEVGKLKADGIVPSLTVILVGDDPASDVYVRNKVQRAQEVGILSIEHRLPANTSQEHLLALIEALNGDASVHGILVQLPLPRHISEQAVIQSLDPLKDVDGFHSHNVGSLAQGLPSFVPCTPAGCLQLLQGVVAELSGKHAVIVGRSNIVGKPMAALLLKADCTVTILHSRSRNVAALCRLADIVVVAAGRPKLVTSDWIKPGAVVIDVGINRVRDLDRARLVGDVDYDDVATVAAALTPVPGGVGPMTIANLMANTVLAARQQSQLKR
ncbi:bifunctional methylenetetrahydrofolate dehydrogenase/methenyltetrahydrofolate cyclohydrolase FolD (plasmid) [Cupriavidus metallidurans]|uniref:bifunctional 5,10-methylenetetrahydrofolate dehydrogenase/5,10-methenyltetrahydrofolate cyclohydrolase n=1 Tax=Cupriavidus metallidurans TaxID=119219 RepID=UPI003D746C40